MPKKTDPATGEQYSENDVYTTLVLSSPITSVVYEFLTTKLWQLSHEDAVYIDNVVTRLEASATNPLEMHRRFHGDPVTIPILSIEEARILDRVLTTPPDAWFTPVCRCVRKQLKYNNL